MRKFLIIPLAACATLLAGDFVRHPVSGYVFDAAKGVIRPVNGLPGAAVLGNPLELPETFSKVFFAPGQSRAIAVTSSGKTALVTLDGQPGMRLLEAVDGVPQRAVFDSKGSSAVMLDSTGLRLQLARGLDGQLEVLESSGLAVGGEVLAMDLDSSGKVLALGLAGSGVYTVNFDNGVAGNAERIADAVSAVSLAFVEGDLVFVDRASNSLMSVTRAAGGWQTSLLADSGDGLDAPVAVRVDARYLVVLNSGSNEILLKSRADGSNSRIPVSAPADRLEPLSAPRLLMLDGINGPAVHMLDWANEARVVFVPTGGQQ